MSDTNQTRVSIAAIAACFAVTLAEGDEEFGPRFERALDTASYALGKLSHDNTSAIETVELVKEIWRDLIE